MTAYDAGRLVEARSMAILHPFLEEKSDGLVLTNKGALGRYLQEVVGDLLLNDKQGRMFAVECKAEEENRYGNFFLETWSNKNLADRAKHALYGSNVGWMQKLRADLLLYHFLKSDDLYVVPLFRLQQWAFESIDGHPRIDAYPEKPQSKYAQANDTWGRCVPIGVIEREVGIKLMHPKQISLFEEPAF